MSRFNHGLFLLSDFPLYSTPPNRCLAAIVFYKNKAASGLGKHRIYGQKADGQTMGVGDYWVSPRGKDQAYNIRMRQHTQNEKYHHAKRASITAKSSDPTSRVGQMFKEVKDELALGASQGSMLQRARDWMSDSSPRRLFAEDSDLWTVGLSTSGREGLLPVADAVFATRQALTNSTDAYTHPEMFSSALESVGIKGQTLKELGGVEGILRDDEKALQAARHVMRNATDNLQTEANRVLQAPSTRQAKRYIREAQSDPNSLYNKFGESRGQVLRRFIFEQGTLATHGNKQTGKMAKKLDTLAARGEINEEMAQQAKVGLMSLDMQVAAGRRLKDPYGELDDMGTAFGTDRGIQQAVGVMRENKDMLAKFAETRPRVDVAYHRDPYSSPDQFGTPFAEAGFFATDTATTAASTYMEGGMDTMRRALDMVGLGWSPTTSLSTTDGIREVGKTWMKRGSAAIAATAGYRLADGGADIMLPDDVPMGEGITMELSNIAANARQSASYIYDALGITDAAQYMEGLAPKSTSALPGAAAGYYATGGILGAVAGATLNRVMQPLMKDTPFEALSILPPLAPFVSDMAESYETTRDKYAGREWIPQRSGRFFMLSTSEYEGGRIESYRPNWYTRQKADVGATPVQYGSKMEEMIFKDLPLIDFAPGDLIDPQYLEKKHAQNRPYASPEVPFSEVPLIGPALGATVGRAYNFLHPLGSNKPVGMEEVVGGFDEGGRPAPGITTAGSSGRQLPSVAGDGHEPYMAENNDVVGAHSPSATLDEQVYRFTEAAGLKGFIGETALGGEGLLRDARTPSASQIDSNIRDYHDLNMGDILGAGEGIRRILPFERGGETHGPRNTMPEWMPQEMKSGDPYCLLPETLIEIDEELVPAAQAHDLVKDGDHYARTHKGRLKRIEASSEREVDETITRIDVDGLPWELAVTDEHPVLVREDKSTTWKLAGEGHPWGRLAV